LGVWIPENIENQLSRLDQSFHRTKYHFSMYFILSFFPQRSIQVISSDSTFGKIRLVPESEMLLFGPLTDTYFTIIYYENCSGSLQFRYQM